MAPCSPAAMPITGLNPESSPIVYGWTMNTIDVLHIAVSWGLLVLIWLVQLILYPAFLRIPERQFTAYHRWYAMRITLIVLPLMIGEIILLMGWWWMGTDRSAAYLATLAVIVVWLSTFRLQVPIHRRLQHGKDDTLIHRLVWTNWIRTAAWTLKAAVVTLVAIRSGL